jgi:hypothetical protein
MKVNTSLADFIAAKKINRTYLADRIGMAKNTFTGKLRKSDVKYHFTKKEEQKVINELDRYSKEISAFVKNKKAN